MLSVFLAVAISLVSPQLQRGIFRIAAYLSMLFANPPLPPYRSVRIKYSKMNVMRHNESPAKRERDSSSTEVAAMGAGGVGEGIERAIQFFDMRLIMLAALRKVFTS